MIDQQLLASRTEDQVLLVGSARTAEAARPKLKAYVILDYEASDELQAIAGRKVDLWPDATPDSKTLFAKAAESLVSLKCPQVRVVNPNGQIHGWNIAEAISEGWTGKQITAFARDHMSVIEKPRKAVTKVETTAAPELISPAYNVQAWGLTCNGSGKPFSNHHNVMVVLERLKHDIWWDSFAHKIKFHDAQGNEAVWSEVDDIGMAIWLQANAAMHGVQPKVVRDAVRRYAAARARNEAQEWLQMIAQGSPWDGQNRLEYLMCIGFGAPRDLYTAAVGRCLMTSIVARLMQPGCKVDTMVVLEGGQGIGKTQALELLGGRWYKLADTSHIDKDFYVGMLGKSVLEFAEMHTSRNNSVDKVKAMLTCTSDNFRDPYGRDNTDHPRTCVFVGTCNSEDWNADETGARRFLPIRCSKVDLDWLRENLVPLYAEALARYLNYKAGNMEDCWWNYPLETAAAEQLERRPDDPWDDIVRSMVGGKNHIFTNDIMSRLLIEDKERDPKTMRRIGSILKRLGFCNTTKRNEQGVSKRCYARVRPLVLL